MCLTVLFCYAMVSMEENNDAAKLVLTRDIRINGPLSLDSIRLNTGGNPLLCDRNALHIGANVTVEGTAPGIVSGYQGAQSAILNSNAQKEHVTVDGGSFDRVYLGARATQTAIPYSVVNGVDFTLNGGQVQQMAVGADGWSGYAGYNVYTGNVNITVNGGTVNRVRIIDRNDISDSVRSQLNGNAVQLILNNGSSIATNELNAAAVETLGGVFYQLECAAQEGSRLEVTDTAGTYRVVGDKAAVAKDGSHIYTSEDGLLTVPAGSYTVGWSSGQTTVYVSAAGADTADGKTPETAVATMDRAFALLEAQQTEAKTVKIVGSYTLSKHLPTHMESISIEGYDADALLILGKNVRLNGATTFDHIRLDAQGTTSGGYMLCCDRNELNLGADFQMVSDDYGKGLCIDSGYYNANDASCNQNPQKERITIHNGTCYMVRLGAEYAVTPSVEVNGVDFTLNGGGVYKLYIGAYGGYWLMKCTAGDTLAPTDTAGQFRICGGKTAIATSADGQKTVLSADGVLSVPEAGEYTVTFSDEVFYTNSGTELTFYQDCTLDLSDVQAREESGKLFVGWADAQGAGVTGTAFTAGTVLYARYVTYADDAFTLAGAQINRSSLKADKQLQFRCMIDAASYGNLTEAVGSVTLGIVSICSEYLGVKELTVDGTYGAYTPLNAAADADTLLQEEDHWVRQYVRPGGDHRRCDRLYLQWQPGADEALCVGFPPRHPCHARQSRPGAGDGAAYRYSRPHLSAIPV